MDHMHQNTNDLLRQQKITQTELERREQQKQQHAAFKRRLADREAKQNATRKHAHKKRKAAKNVVDTVHELVNSKEAKDAKDEVTGAVLVNDYIMKQIQNDPKNHIKEHEVTEMIVGKP